MVLMNSRDFCLVSSSTVVDVFNKVTRSSWVFRVEDVCGYREEDIRVMKDNETTEEDMRPKNVNIVRLLVTMLFVHSLCALGAEKCPPPTALGIAILGRWCHTG